MPAGESALEIRDSELSPPLASPTTISGTVDDETGVITGATLSTPPLEFDTIVLGGTPVHVKATFTQVTPGGGTGLVTPTPPAAPDGEGQKGQITLRDTVKVDLNLKIGNPLILEANCSSSPVNLELLSTTPYTQAEGGTIQDANFTVPDVPTTVGCIAPVASNVNTLLAGSGHSLSMFIEGDLPVPPIKPATTTSLTVDPADGSLRGTEVTLTAAVAPVEPNELDPSGSVVFKEGTKILGTAELAPDGTASLTTTELRAGQRELTAEYQGDIEFGPSTSAAVPYTVAPAPIVTGTFPEYLPRGTGPVEFDLSVDNADSTRALDNGRVDLILQGMNPGDVVIERQLPDTTWQNVPLNFVVAYGGIAGTLGPEGGAVVPAGAVQTHRLRISAPNTTRVRPARLDVKLVAADSAPATTDPAVASSSWPFNIVQAERVATTTTTRVFDVAVRPGSVLYVQADVFPATTGEVEFLIDGKVVPFRPTRGYGPLVPKQTRAVVSESGSANGEVDIPADLAAGPHRVTAHYLGDNSFLPSISQTVEEVVILPVWESLGALYTCDYVSLNTAQMGAYVQAYVRLPAHAEDGEELDLEDLEVTLVPGGIVHTGLLPLLPTAGDSGVNSVKISLGDAGTIEGDGMAYEPNFETPDQFLRLLNLEGTVVVDGEPGEVMPLPIEKVELLGTDTLIGAQFTFTCAPQAEPVILDEVGVAGISLTAESASDPVRSGDEVVLTAVAAPASPTGLIEFFSGSQSLGTASGATGTATLTVDDLPVGTNALTARYYGVPGSPYQSDVVEIEVRDTIECAEFAEPGTSATVRLVYLELLGRCPDQAGFDFWKNRLDGGTSSEVFARTISATPEAVGMVVDDAYVTMLGRPADASGKAFWVERMRTGTGRYDQLLADLGASPEFWSQSESSNAGFVNRVYWQLLDRAPDQAGQDFWVGRLNAGTSPRALILSLANLDEPLGVLVTDSYVEILGRTPSADERTSGIAFLRSTGDRSGLYAQLIGTQEFVDRAQSFPNPED